MAAVELRETTDAEFARWRPVLIRHFVDSVVANRGISPAQAELRAEEDTASSLPDGPRTPGQLLRTAFSNDTEVGFIWVSLPGHAVPSMGWLSEIIVNERHRAHGYGRAMIETIESELATLGVDRLGLNVFGDNPIARGLYESMGFTVIRQQRLRSLTDGPLSGSADAPPVVLAPIGKAAFEARMVSYEASLARERGLSAADAKKQAWRFLPRGRATDDHYLRTVHAGGAEAGWVFYALDQPDLPGSGWIYRLDIDPEFRCRGYGAAAVAAVEADLAARGAPSVGATVVGDPVAFRLADRLGFGVVAQQMSKKLPTLPG